MVQFIGLFAPKMNVKMFSNARYMAFTNKMKKTAEFRVLIWTFFLCYLANIEAIDK